MFWSALNWWIDVDRLTKSKRSWNMSRIRGRDTGLEKVVRSLLHRSGYRFRLHRADLPGRPDIVLPKHETVILVHGCFWHRHARCRFAYSPKSNVVFWRNKFAQNLLRDKQVRRKLRKLGWRVVVIWECQTTDAESLSSRLHSMLRKP